MLFRDPQGGAEHHRGLTFDKSYLFNEKADETLYSLKGSGLTFHSLGICTSAPKRKHHRQVHGPRPSPPQHSITSIPLTLHIIGRRFRGLSFQPSLLPGLLPIPTHPLMAHNWDCITTNNWVLEIIHHSYTIEFLFLPPKKTLPGSSSGTSLKRRFFAG